ncbi:Outer membrane receptor proteins, mostly Fe transport [Saccharicrinis carchari]|uniref:Outer membrane receptor proteins, mostly Fe transport n=1 Tax=Saccharicrinis carchari TaxID=1168039 RepID=A0A521AD88_SACCC|nr:TonB-dependent receptor [Saccharicrinis carchari]SMO32736.1 Outer membrane receptor proteins, mostly Fe transport [Saccharicrinis carchari]
MRRITILALCAIMAGKLLAQVNLSGYVTDDTTGEPLIGVSVYCTETEQGQASNAFGYFNFTFADKGKYSIQFSYVGYAPYKARFDIKDDTLMGITLQPGLDIQEISVKAQKPIEERAEISTAQLTMKEVKRIPALGGEVDLIKALQLLPGVSQGSEGSSGMYVRGGSPDQNLILLDDVPLYYVNHLGGFVSTFNPDAIQNVTLIKGGFPARYGSRLSSVLDVRMKNGNTKQFKGHATVGMVSSKLTLEGPVKKETSSYLISVRRMMYDILMRPLTPLLFNGAGMGYNFYDANAKYNHKLSHRDRLYLSFYMGDDRSITSFKPKDSDITSKGKLRWGNTLAALRWNHVFNPKLFNNLTASYTQYRNTMEQNYKGSGSKFDYRFLSKVSDATLKTDFDWFVGNTYTLRTGANIIYHRYLPSRMNNKQSVDGVTNDSTHVNYREEAMEANVYIENEIQLSPNISFNLGLRYANYKVDRKIYPSIEPRLAFNYRFMPHHSLKLGYAQMQQNVHLLTGSSTGMPSDYWLPPTKRLAPQLSVQYSVGWAHTTADKKFEISVEAYYKEMDNLISFKDGVSYFTGLGNWENHVEGKGKGTARGIEFFLKKNKGKTTGWIGYTLSETTRKFGEVNQGKRYPYRYDRPHDISIVVQHQIRPSIDVFASWVYNTGNAITLAKEHFMVPHEPKDEYEKPYVSVEIYDGKNSTRMQAYHRLDVGINFIKKRSRGERIWRLSVYNLYNRQNAYYYFWDNELNAIGWELTEPRLYKQTLFPIIPSVSYSWTF